ncbi:MAG: sugar phosphate isomerase/epimerase [Armatimonadetes bacterium]|nr:sugar phosphate isomerase/epimerase [Armatimonadota bacterium]
MKFAICNETFQGWTWEDTCREAARTGYDGVEIAPFTLAESVTGISAAKRQEIRGVAEGEGLEIIGLHWLLVSPKGLYVNHPDAALRRKTLDYLKSLIDFCGDLGGRVMVFGSPKQRNVHPDLTYAQAWDYAKEAFSACTELLAAREIALCLEPLSKQETDFFLSAAEAARMVEEIGHPNLRLHLDVKAMSSEEEPIPQIIRKFGPVTGHFHANDANLRAPGFGDIDFAPIFEALREAGYDRYVSIEVFDYTPDPQTIATKGLAYLKERYQKVYGF